MRTVFDDERHYVGATTVKEGDEVGDEAGTAAAAAEASAAEQAACRDRFSYYLEGLGAAADEPEATTFFLVDCDVAVLADAGQASDQARENRTEQTRQHY